MFNPLNTSHLRLISRFFGLATYAAFWADVASPSHKHILVRMVGPPPVKGWRIPWLIWQIWVQKLFSDWSGSKRLVGHINPGFLQ